MRDLRITGTTILGVKKDNCIAIGGDGQVTLGHSSVKHNANKIRKLFDGSVIVGFAGAVGDSFALLERFEAKLRANQGNLLRSAIDLAKEWRLDKYLRHLESMMIAADKERILLLSGSGEVIEPDDGIVGIGSGGEYAVAAARALLLYTNLNAKEIVERAMKIASDICIYTNSNITIEVLET